MPQLFKLPLEKEGQLGGPILAPEEMKTIFGSIPDIYEVHTRIKVGVADTADRRVIGCATGVCSFVCFVSAPNQSDLEELLTDWSEDCSVGDVILKYVSLDDGRSSRVGVPPQRKCHPSTRRDARRQPCDQEL